MTNLMRTSHRILLTAAAGLGLAAASAPRPAQACGGFFCSNTPVVQTGEQIIFGIDHQADTTEAIINIQYQGAAPDFAWLLPLVAAPLDIDVGPSRAFQVGDQLTRPTFQITRFETRGICGGGDVLLRGAEDSATTGAGGQAPPNADPGVEVISQEQVGPYDTVVLSGSDPEAVRTWLVDNGYRVTDTMMEAVVPYVAKGDVLLALKLANDQDTGDIQPVWLSLPRAEACIPLRLTAIAAQADMDVTALVLSDQGRAIPENYFHVTPNLARIDWIRGGNNYRQVIGDAADEAGGNAFTTEYSGPTSIFRDQIYRDGQYDLSRARSSNDLGVFLRVLQDTGLRGRAEVRGIVTRYFPQVAACPRCRAEDFVGTIVDTTAALDEIEERVIRPERRAQELFDGFQHLTRLFTLISPEEMSLDPLFTFDASLPAISNRHEATLVQHCGVGGTPGSAGVEVHLDDGTVIAFDGQVTDRSGLDAMPAAARIEQLAERTLVRDNTTAIMDQLDEHNDRNGLGGCGCASADRASRAGGLASVAALLALFGLVVSRRRR